MANSYSAEAVALQVQRARVRLALSKPFLASAVLRLPLVPVQSQAVKAEIKAAMQEAGVL